MQTQELPQLEYKILDGESDSLGMLYQVRKDFFLKQFTSEQDNCQFDYDRRSKHVIATVKGGGPVGSLSLVTRGEMPAAEYIPFPLSDLDRPICEAKLLSVGGQLDREMKRSSPLVLGLKWGIRLRVFADDTPFSPALHSQSTQSNHTRGLKRGNGTGALDCLQGDCLF